MVKQHRLLTVTKHNSMKTRLTYPYLERVNRIRWIEPLSLRGHTEMWKHVIHGIKLIFISLLSILFTLPNSSWAEVQAFLNQTNVYTNDPVILTIETNANTNEQPDLAPLNKDFTILSTNNRSQISIINGKSSAKKSWVIQLQPLRQGTITIPAITLGKEQTKTLTLTISDIPPEITAQTKKHVFVEANVALKEGKSPYIQQQISYTVKLFYDDQLLEYEMYPPNIEHAVIEQLQQKDKYRVSRDGKTYTVIERNYVISAEKSGKLTIPPTIVKGSIRKKQEKNQHQQNPFQNDPFFNDPFGSTFFSGSLFGERGKAITLRSKPITVDVQPLPTAFKGSNWLPAEKVILTDSWQQQLPTFRVGEPVTRTLSIEAKGLASSQIPKLELLQIDTIRAYPDQEANQNYTDGTTVIGKHTQTISYIPNKTGKVKIPEIKLDWWNVITKQQQTTQLPALTINIEAGSGTTLKTEKTSSLEQENKPQSGVNTSLLTVKDSNISKSAMDKSSFPFPLIILIGLSSIIFIIIKNKNILYDQYHQKFKTPKNSISQKNLKKRLQQACENNDPQQTAHYLLMLVQQQWTDNPPQNLGTLAKQVASGKNVIKQLNHQLYAENNTHWKGAELWKLVETGLQRKIPQEVSSTDGLNALYPTR